jgi:N6-adenosine-specific RNA methylase IME4
MIERMFPDLPKLELFARQARPGWEVWGNEVNKFDNGYDVHDDVTKSFDAAYEAIRQRMAKGGPGWLPK